MIAILEVKNRSFDLLILQATEASTQLSKVDSLKLLAMKGSTLFSMQTQFPHASSDKLELDTAQAKLLSFVKP